MIINAIIPAYAIATSEFSPSVALILPLLTVSSWKGNAPALILLARSVASLAVKSPSICALPSVIAEFTVGAESIISSIQIEIVLLTYCDVISPKVLAPSSVNSRLTTYCDSPLSV